MQADRRRLLRGFLVAVAPSWLPSGALAGEGTTTRRLRSTATFANPLNGSLNEQMFWCYLPAHAPEFQRVVDVKVSMPHRVLSDVWGHRVLELSFDHFAAFDQKVVSIAVETELTTEPRMQTLRDPSVWLASERFVESEDDHVRLAAAALRFETPTATARAIFDWVAANIEYAGYLADDLGALYALVNRRGDCTEFADLVVAMLRANGIPARMVGGYVVDRDSALRPHEYHNWAEAYLSGAWRVVDAQRQRWLPPRSEYVAFRICRDVSTSPVGQAHRYLMRGALQTTF